MSADGLPGLPLSTAGKSLSRPPWPQSRGTTNKRLENVCWAVMYKIDSGINMHKKITYHTVEFQNTEFVSAEPKGKLLLVSAAHKVEL